MSDDTLTIPGPRGDTGYVDGKHSWSPWTGKHTRPRSASKQIAAIGSVLYAVAVGDDTIKIGYTTDVVRRLDHLRSETSQPCRLLAIRFGSMDDEREVHQSLAAFRSHGREYYHPHPEVLALVDQWRQAMGQAPLAD